MRIVQNISFRSLEERQRLRDAAFRWRREGDFHSRWTTPISDFIRHLVEEWERNNPPKDRADG